MTKAFTKALETLDENQREAVNWRNGSLILYAGPGTGKTQVLTTRIAKILNESNEKTRILALTYTNKAADEMKSRVNGFVPNEFNRYFIGTIHKFCSKLLKSYGEKIGIRPDFTIKSRDTELSDIVNDAMESVGIYDDLKKMTSRRYLRNINSFRRNLVEGKNFEGSLRDHCDDDRFPKVYKAYEKALHQLNALDFNGLIINATRLVSQEPHIFSEYRKLYRYWFIDEFQDTTKTQYHFLKLLAGRDFDNIFVVADEDQIIFEWAGASHNQLKNFKSDFNATIKEIDINRRCPKQIVDVANRMIRNNKNRFSKKATLKPYTHDSIAPIKVRSFFDEFDEAQGVVEEILNHLSKDNSQLAVIGKTNKALRPTLSGFRKRNIKASIVKRRDEFLTPHFKWLLSCLELVSQPDSLSSFKNLVLSGNSLTGTEYDPENLISQENNDRNSFLQVWMDLIGKANTEYSDQLVDIAFQLKQFEHSWSEIVEVAIERMLDSQNSYGQLPNDFREDMEAWKCIYDGLISSNSSEIELKEFIQEMNIRSKEPPFDPAVLRLFTIHTAKGLEFDHVWIVGMAEEILPSYQSLKEDADPNLLEAERRACFVGVTRTKRTLNLSYARSYQGYSKVRSRFLNEMGLLANDDIRDS